MFITRQMLRRADTPYNQRVAFREEWPNGVEVDRASLEKAAELGLEMYRFAFGLFRSNQLSYEAWGVYIHGEYEAEEAYSHVIKRCSPYYPYYGRAAVSRVYGQATITALLKAIECPTST